MEDIYYDKIFLKSLRAYLRANFTDVFSSYRHRSYISFRGTPTAKIRGVILSAKSNDCSMRFEIWGDSEIVEVDFVYGDVGKKRKIFRSYIQIGSGIFGEFLPQEVDFINKVLEKTSLTGNNALDFILRD